MDGSSSPHMVMRINGSVPEGRTSRRPLTDFSLSSYSRRSFLAWSEVLRACFCVGVASRFTMTWGYFTMMLARVCKDLLVSETTLVTMRAVSMPSPVASPGRMMWPDCSPPISIFCSRIAAATLESPTAVISVLTLLSVAQLRRPWLAMTVMAILSMFK